MKNIQTLVIDINKKPFQSVTANVGEVGSRYIRINVVDRSLAVDLTGVTVSIYAKKPDGKKIFNSTTIEDAKQGIVIAELTSQVLAVEGLVTLTLRLDKYGSKLCSKKFILRVDSCIVDDEAIESTNEFTALTDALGRVNNIDNRFEDVGRQFETKANKNEIFSMANMGQDIKEAMTGGSVAVVGKDAILEENIVDGQVTIDKLNSNISEYLNDAYKSNIAEVNTNGWFSVKFNNANIIPIGTNIKIDLTILSGCTIKTGGGIYYASTFCSENIIPANNIVSQTLTVTTKDIPSGKLEILFQVNGKTSNDLIVKDIDANSYPFISIGAFNKTHSFVNYYYSDRSLSTYKYVDDRMSKYKPQADTIDSTMIQSNSINENHYATKSIDISHVNPYFYDEWDGIRVLNRPLYLMHKFNISENEIKIGDTLEIEMSLQDNTQIHEGGSSYNSIVFEFWGGGIANESTNITSRLISFPKLITYITDYRKPKLYTISTVATSDIENDYLLLYCTLNLPASTYNIDTYIKYSLKINGIYVDTIFKGIYNSPNGLCEQAKHLKTQLLSAEHIVDYVEESKSIAISESIKRTQVENSWLFGKRWGIMGDSLSDPTHPDGNFAYYTYISNKYNMTIDRQAKSGASLLNAHGPFKQVEDLSGDFDLITCWIGTNDYNYQNTETYGTKIEELINRIIERFPYAKIMFISPASNLHVNGLDDDINKENSMWQYVVELQKRCKKYSIPVLDMYSNAGFNPHIDAWNTKYYKNADKCHFNPEGMARINPIIENFLLSN